MKKPKILIVLGPTASGKSSLAVELAQKFNGEVISADSRQVYRGLNIGTGKITKRETKGVPHHLLDVADPRRQFSVDRFKILAEKAIAEILARDRTPILCGGTGFYIQSISEGVVLPEVAENKKLRASLSKLSAEKLFAKLKKLDPNRTETIDRNNPVRLIRAIEIATALGSVPEMIREPKYRTLQIGLKTDPKILREKIDKRLLSRMRNGMIAEAKKLHAAGLSWKRMEKLGLEYRYLARFLQGKMTREEMLERLEFEIWHYALRQMQWFRKKKNISWMKLSEKKRIEQKVKDFLNR